MNVKWFASLSEKEKEELKADLQAAKPALRRLERLIQDKIDENDRRQLDRSSYDNASWPYFQSDCLGYRRACSEIDKLIAEVING